MKLRSNQLSLLRLPYSADCTMRSLSATESRNLNSHPNTYITSDKPEFVTVPAQTGNSLPLWLSMFHGCPSLESISMLQRAVLQMMLLQSSLGRIKFWHVGVDLNSFIRDPSFSPKKKLLSPNFRLPAFYLSPKYVVFMCAMYVVFCSRQWLLLYWQTQNRNFTVCQHVSST